VSVARRVAIIPSWNSAVDAPGHEAPCSPATWAARGGEGLGDVQVGAPCQPSRDAERLAERCAAWAAPRRRAAGPVARRRLPRPGRSPPRRTRRPSGWPGPRRTRRPARRTSEARVSRADLRARRRHSASAHAPAGSAGAGERAGTVRRGRRPRSRVSSADANASASAPGRRGSAP
jgi:hypothetical protein